MSRDRDKFVRKTPAEVLQDVLAGHANALSSGSAPARKYIENFIEKSNSIPNAVKFFVYDLLVEDTYNCEDGAACDEAVKMAIEHIEDAKADAAREFKDYMPKMRCFERGISLAVDSGEYKAAMDLCDKAMALGLGRHYQSKKESIEGMM